MKGKARILIGLAAAALIVLAMGVPALADNDLHDKDNFLAEADSCAGCHRAHTAQAAKLLTVGPNQDDFCFSCHDGTGAETNVVDGALVAGTSYGVGNDTDGNPLRGGGFVNAMMDPNHDGNVTSASVTSTHAADGVGAGNDTIWGSGTINASADVGVTVNLACGDCHNPHGNGNYRILRGNPDGMENEGTTPAVDVTDQSPVVYEVTHVDNTVGNNTYWARDMADYSSPTTNEIGEWCGQCHTRYWVASGSGHTDSTDAIFAYRHMTDGLSGSCLVCHVAHGTSATMGTYSGAVNLPGGTPGTGGGGASDSRLLTGNSRTVCTDPTSCHGTGSGTWDLTAD